MAQEVNGTTVTEFNGAQLTLANGSGSRCARRSSSTGRKRRAHKPAVTDFELAECCKSRS